MADINVQPKHQSPLWLWLLLILIAAGLLYFLVHRERTVVVTEPRAQHGTAHNPK